MNLWNSRFTEKLNPDAFDLNASIGIDKRLATQDVVGSIAWVKALEKADVLSNGEAAIILSALETILSEFQNHSFQFLESDEDIHTAVERRLIELVGPLGGKVHTGRSRNDQVATDFRLWFLENLPSLVKSIRVFQNVLIQRSQTDQDVLLPGYTHFQPAQPILLSHWWLSFFWPLQRDVERIFDLIERTASLPLGSGALAGTAYPIDRTMLANALGFSSASPNSLDAVSDRDFVLEFSFISAVIGIHLSRLSEAVILFCNPSFAYFQLPDSFSTGSSLMPQKKNPDLFEITRSKSGNLIGELVSLLCILKALPSFYDKDLQEDKVHTFQSFDTLMSVLSVLSQAIQKISLNREKMAGAILPSLMATDIADYLVQKGIPFREAHHITGRLILHAEQNNVNLDQLELVDFQSYHADIDVGIYECLLPAYSVARRNAVGGTAPEAVKRQIEQALQAVNSTYR